MKQRSSYWQLRTYAHPQWAILLPALFCTLALTATWPFLASLGAQISKAFSQGQVGAVAQCAGLAALIWGGQKVAQTGQDTLIAKLALQITLALRQQAFAHTQYLSLSHFESMPTGDLTYRLTEDVDRIGEVISKLFRHFLPNVLRLIVMFGVILQSNWQLTLTLFVVAPLLAIMIAWFGEQLRKLSYRSQSRVSDLSALLTEMFSGIRLIQAFAAEDYAIERFRQAAERNRRAMYGTERLRAIQYPVQGTLEALSVLALLLIGSWQIAQNHLTSDQFVGYVVSVVIMFEPISTLTNTYNELKLGEASADRVLELFQLQPAIVEQPQAPDLPIVKGQIEFRHVSFAYHPDRPIFQDLTLTVASGEQIALVGTSGAGKTTLVNLIPRFYDPQAGAILIDGQDIRQVSLKSLRRQIGIVPQETTLFTGTIAENIAFGRFKFDLEAVQAAAKVANADQFIRQFPQGYQTWVGERGVNLSGGQRQRLAIARAVLLNPRILILDEATSALDSESEALVQEALERIMVGRTVFVIAHRLATVRRVDRILVLEQGQVLESGTHQELIAQAGRYARFYAQQFS